MNKIMSIGLACSLFAAASLSALHSESVELRKADKTVRVQVRYYDDEEWKSCGSQFINEGFDRCCNHVAVKADDSSLAVCGDFFKFVTPTEEHLEDTYQEMFLDGQFWQVRDAFLNHYFWMTCAMRIPNAFDEVSTLETIIIAHKTDEVDGQDILAPFKAAMRNVADADPALIYCETSEYSVSKQIS